VIISSTKTEVGNCIDTVCSPTPTPTVTNTPSVTNTPTITITPTVTLTPTPTASVTWTYYRTPGLCCDSTDSPITTNIALPSSYGYTGGEQVLLNGHAYTLGLIQSPQGNETIITDVSSTSYNSCEDAVSAAVSLYGNTSGCRYTFRPCCDSMIESYDDFSTQGPVLGNYVLSQPTVLVDTNGYSLGVNICSSLFEYDNTVTIDNSVLNNFNVIDQTQTCGGNRCSRCVAKVSPCSDPTTVISWVYTPQAGFAYDVGDVYLGSNINGYTTNTNYTVDVSCVQIVDYTQTVNEGTMYTVTDVVTTSPYYGTQTYMINGCDCRTGVIVENSYGNSTGRGDGTNILYLWHNCNGTLQTHQLNAGQGEVTYYTIPGCIDITTLTWSSTFDPGAGIDYEGDCCNGAS
jgi:hypothetical protein